MAGVEEETGSDRGSGGEEGDWWRVGEEETGADGSCGGEEEERKRGGMGDLFKIRTDNPSSPPISVA